MEWTEERIETLSRLWREGHSASQVARRLGGVTRNAVIGKAHRLGLSVRDAPSRPNLPGAPAAVRAPPVRAIPTARPCEARPGLSNLRPHPAFELSPTATLMS